MAEPIEQRAEVDGLEVFWREVPATDGGSPILYLHGVPVTPTSGLPFLERTGGVALDLPGFGRSAKPADFHYSIEGYAGFLEAFTREGRPRPHAARRSRLGRARPRASRSGSRNGSSGSS